MAGKAKGSLQLVAGVGKSYTIEGEVAAKYADLEVEDALGELIRERIRDPELQAMFEDPTSVLEFFAEDSNGRIQEAPLSRSDSWRRIVESMEENECEIDIARRHRGGALAVRKEAE